jgi:hypothetical protein
MYVCSNKVNGEAADNVQPCSTSERRVRREITRLRHQHLAKIRKGVRFASRVCLARPDNPNTVVARHTFGPCPGKDLHCLIVGTDLMFLCVCDEPPCIRLELVSAMSTQGTPGGMGANLMPGYLDSY